MIAMIFEFAFDPADPDAYDEYTAEAALLRELLPDVEGFHGIEKFQSVNDPNKYVSIAFFDDEAAVAAWRNRPEHRSAQALGRSRFFADYRLVMAEVTRDYGPDDRAGAPADSRLVHG